MTTPASPKRNAIEWTVFALGTAMTVGIAGFLAMEAVRGDGTVNLSLTVARVGNSPAGADVTLRVENAGDAAAKDVDAEACDAAGACVPFSFDQVPAGSTVERIVRCESDSGPYEGRVLGWQVGG